MKKTAYLFSVVLAVVFMAISYLKPSNINAQDSVLPSGFYWYQDCLYWNNGDLRLGGECTSDQGHCGVLSPCG